MYRKISRDVKLAAIHLHEHQLLSLENILACVRFSDSKHICHGAFSSSGVKPVMSSASPTVFADALIFSSAMMSFISFVLSVTAWSGSWTNYSCYWIQIASYSPVQWCPLSHSSCLSLPGVVLGRTTCATGYQSFHICTLCHHSPWTQTCRRPPQKTCPHCLRHDCRWVFPSCSAVKLRHKEHICR